MNTITRWFGVVAAIVTLAGCASVVNQAQIEGPLYTRVHMNRFPVVVSAIDGESTPTWRPIWIAPGVRTLTFDAPPPRGFHLPVRKAVRFDVKPCTRYHFGAQRANALSHDWELVVDHEEPIPGCAVGTLKSAQRTLTLADQRVAPHL
jgi:hypothetical protein